MKVKLLVCLVLMNVPQISWTQEPPATLAARVGQPNQLSLRIAGEDQTRCNLELLIPGAGSVEREVLAPDYNITLDITPQQPGTIAIQYQGKTKFRGFNTVSACNARGRILVEASLSAEENKQVWEKHLANLPAERAACVRYGLFKSQLPIESTDPSAVLVAVNNPAARGIFAKCDEFFQKPQPRKNYECVVGVVRTRCDGVYAERQPDGRLRAITLERAFQLHFDGGQWTVGQSESADAKQARLAQEADAERSRVEAERARVETERRRIEVERAAADKARAAAAAASAERSRTQQDVERERTSASSSAPSRPAPNVPPSASPETPAPKQKQKVGTALDI